MWPELPINGIALGQILSLLVTCTSSISTELALRGASIPFTQGAIQYALLFLAFSGPLRLFWWRWKESAWKYMLVSGIDVLSTGCIVKAFSLTSVTSVTLLDSWTIPCVILLTAVFFRQRYTARQMLSAIVAVSGLAVLLVFDDTNESSASGRTSALMGDALVIAGATGYAANNVLTEHILKTGDPAELLGGMGCFGVIASAVLVPLTEAEALANITWTWPVVILLAAYGAALFLFSLGMPVLLHRSGSTVFNLSLLTSDFYAFAVRGVFFEGFSRQSLGVYLLSCAAVVCGLVVYFTCPDAAQHAHAHAATHPATHPAQYAAVDLYDTYTTPEDRPSCASEQGGGEGRMRRSDDGGSGERRAAEGSYVTVSCKECGPSSASLGKQGTGAGGMHGACSMIGGPVLSGGASGVVGEHSSCGGDMHDGLQMTTSGVQVAWEYEDTGDAGDPTTGTSSAVQIGCRDGAVIALDDA